MYSKSEIEIMLTKAVMDGKTKTLKYCLSYIEFLLTPINKQLEYIQENGWTYSENFLRLDASKATLFDIKNQLQKTLKDLKSKENGEKRTEP